MTTEPVWVSLDHATRINKRILVGAPENHFVRDIAALEAGIDRPKNRFHIARLTRLPVLATHLIYGVGKAHAFEQGNKRTAWLLARYFLELNGYTLRYPHDDRRRSAMQLELAKLVERLMSDDAAFETLAEEIDAHLVIRRG